MRRCALLLMLAIVAALAARRGPDFYEYSEWARAASTGDVGSLQSTAVSPCGVPLSQWAHGAGFLFGIPKAIGGDLLSDRLAARAASAVASILLAWSFWGLLKMAARGDRLLAAAGAALAFFATPAGYYSISFSSELFALASCSLLFYFALAPGTLGVARAAGAGVSAAILVTVRTQLVLFAVFGLSICLYKLWKSRTHSRADTVWSAGFLSLPLAVGAAQVALTRFWMTGSPWKSPYLFGDSGFRSVEYFNASRWASFVHPWHGLFIYHPFFLVGIAALAWLAARSRPRLERGLWLGACAVVAVQWIHQASWYCWWMGDGTFGARGFVVASLLCVPAVVSLAASSHRYFWLLVALACGVWSYPLLALGESNFTTYAALVSASTQTILSPEGFAPPVAAALSVMFSARHDTEGRSRRWLGRAVEFAGGLAFCYLVRRALGNVGLDVRTVWVAAIVGALAAAAGSAGTRLLLHPAAERPDGLFPAGTRAIQIVVAVLSLIFAVETALFLRLASRTQLPAVEALKHPAPNALAFDPVAARAALEEYARVEGFEAEKARLASFLQRVAPESSPASR
jgi:hypothetical protein